MKTKFIAITISLIAILLTGCGQEKAEQKPSSLPQAAPAQQANTPLPDKVEKVKTKLQKFIKKFK